MPEWLDYTGALASAIGLVVACVTLWAATKAREAAQQARDAVRMEALADALDDVEQWVGLLVQAAGRQDEQLYSGVGAELLSRMRRLLGRQDPVLREGRREFDRGANRLRQSLTDLAGLTEADEVAAFFGQAYATALEMRGHLAEQAGATRSSTASVPPRG